MAPSAQRADALAARQEPRGFVVRQPSGSERVSLPAGSPPAAAAAFPSAPLLASLARWCRRCRCRCVGADSATERVGLARPRAAARAERERRAAGVLSRVRWDPGRPDPRRARGGVAQGSAAEMRKSGEAAFMQLRATRSRRRSPSLSRSEPTRRRWRQRRWRRRRKRRWRRCPAAVPARLRLRLRLRWRAWGWARRRWVPPGHVALASQQDAVVGRVGHRPDRAAARRARRRRRVGGQRARWRRRRRGRTTARRRAWSCRSCGRSCSSGSGELCAVACVCRMLRSASATPSLWSRRLRPSSAPRPTPPPRRPPSAPQSAARRQR